MPKLGSMEIPEGMYYDLICPGCETTHAFSVRPGGGGWSFNGDMERPTISPSLLVTSGHYSQGHVGAACWCSYNAEHPGDIIPFKCFRCHSYIEDGNIRFLGDCSHSLAGKTVPLPERFPDRPSIGADS